MRRVAGWVVAVVAVLICSLLPTSAVAADSRPYANAASCPTGGTWETSPACDPSASNGTGSGFCANAAPGGAPLSGASFDDVYACGPPANTGKGYYVPWRGTLKGFFEDSRWEYQCVELANRFFWVSYGAGHNEQPISGAPLVGGNYVATLAAAYKLPTDSPGNGAIPVAGDIISMWGGASGQAEDGSLTHVAVVTSNPTGSAATGWSFSVLEENAVPNLGSSTVSISPTGRWTYHGGYYKQFQWVVFQEATALSGHTDGYCALLRSQQVACWGGNGVGLLGDGTSASNSYVPVDVEGLGDAKSLASGDGPGVNACALLSTGRVACWGSNGSGALGNGGKESRVERPSPRGRYCECYRCVQPRQRRC